MVDKLSDICEPTAQPALIWHAHSIELLSQRSASTGTIAEPGDLSLLSGSSSMMC
jgi:hypothetical protein